MSVSCSNCGLFDAAFAARISCLTCTVRTKGLEDALPSYSILSKHIQGSEKGKRTRKGGGNRPPRFPKNGLISKRNSSLSNVRRILVYLFSWFIFLIRILADGRWSLRVGGGWLDFGIRVSENWWSTSAGRRRGDVIGFGGPARVMQVPNRLRLTMDVSLIEPARRLASLRLIAAVLLMNLKLGYCKKTPCPLVSVCFWKVRKVCMWLL